MGRSKELKAKVMPAVKKEVMSNVKTLKQKKKAKSALSKVTCGKSPKKISRDTIRPPEEKTDLQISLNGNLLGTDLMKNLSTSWRKGDNFISEGILIFDTLPFKHLSIKKLISDGDFLQCLSSELQKIPYERMLNDLFSFHQTDSLFDIKGSSPCIENVLSLISGPLRSWVQDITGIKFSSKITATASQYKYCDRLLCHDDNLADRSVAFIFYLCNDWTNEDGGALDLFMCDSENQPQSVVKSLYPDYGSFVFFEVTNKSYHQVAEVLSANKTRLSINGWYHGNPLPAQIQWNESPPKMLAPIQLRDCAIPKWINPSWLDLETNGMVKESFSKDLSIALPKFLIPSMYKKMQNALKVDTIVWKPCGPANRRCYEVAQENTVPAIVKDYLQLMRSKFWFRLLSEYTVDIDPDVKPKPKSTFEIQRWQKGDYTLLVDNDPTSFTGIDMHLYFNVSRPENVDGGEVHYLGPDKNEAGFLEQAAHLEPQNNVATFIARIEGMARVTKYLDHRSCTPYHKIIATYTQG